MRLASALRTTRRRWTPLSNTCLKLLISTLRGRRHDAGLRKEALGLRDDPLNVREELGLRERNHVKPTHAVGVFDHYANGYGRIHLHARILWVEGDRSEWCALFEPHRRHVGDRGIWGISEDGDDLGIDLRQHLAGGQRVVRGGGDRGVQ